MKWLLVLLLACPLIAQSHSAAGDRNRAIGIVYGTALTQGTYCIISKALPKSMPGYERRGWAAAGGFVAGLAGVLALSAYHRDVQKGWGPMYLESMQRPEYMTYATFTLTFGNFLHREIKGRR